MNLKEWLSKIREYSDENIKIALIANKNDLTEDFKINMKKNIFSNSIYDALAKKN